MPPLPAVPPVLLKSGFLPPCCRQSIAEPLLPLVQELKPAGRQSCKVFHFAESTAFAAFPCYFKEILRYLNFIQNCHGCL